MSEHCSVLSDRDPPGWYECRLGDDTVRCPVWWDGYKLWPSPDAMASLDVTLFADFRRLVYAEPTPQPGVAELVEACRAITDAYARAMQDAGVTRYPETLVVVRNAREALAAAEAGEQERTL